MRWTFLVGVDDGLDVSNLFLDYKNVPSQKDMFTLKC